jgi:hypothetical protein
MWTRFIRLRLMAVGRPCADGDELVFCEQRVVCVCVSYLSFSRRTILPVVSILFRALSFSSSLLFPYSSCVFFILPDPLLYQREII